MRASVRDLQALPLAVGALSGALSVTLASGVAALVCALAGLLIISLAGRRRWYAIFLFGFAMASFAAVLLRPAAVPADFFDGTERSFVAEALEVRDSPKGQRIVAEISEDAWPPFRAILYTTDITEPIAVGDIFAAKAVFFRSGRMDEVPFLSQNGLYSRGNRAAAMAMVDPYHVEICGHNATLGSFCASIRDKVALCFYSSSLNPLTASLLAASLLGTSDAPPEISDRFRATGLAHLLCVSGFHVGVVAALFSLLFMPLRLLRKGREVAYVLLIAVVWCYAALTGLMPSAIRAAIMLSCFFAVRMMQRVYSPANTLALAVAIMLVVNPYWIYSPGFMLSVGAVAGLILFGRHLNPVPIEYGRARRVASLFVVPLAAMLGTSPIVLALFHRLPLMFVPINAFGAMLFPLFLLSGCAYTGMRLLGMEWRLLSDIVEMMHDELMRLCDFGAAFEIADIYLSTTTLVSVVLVLLLCAAVLHLSSLRHRLAVGVAMVACVCFAACDENESLGNQLLIDGNVYSTELYIIDGDSARAYSTALTPRRLSLHSDFFAGQGFGDADIQWSTLQAGEMVKCRDKIVVYAGKDVPDCSGCIDYLLVDMRFRGDYAALLDNCRPLCLVVGAGIPKARLAQLMSIAQARAVPYIILAERPVYLSDF